MYHISSSMVMPDNVHHYLAIGCIDQYTSAEQISVFFISNKIVAHKLKFIIESISKRHH